MHTPGPWDKIAKMNGFTAVGGTTLIARVFSTAFGDHENEESNARLIAAAPEMLEALRIVHGRKIANFTLDEWSKIEAAISKAEGLSTTSAER